MGAFILGVVVGLLCFHWGYEHAHRTVAAECERLGGFFVERTVYRCYAIKNMDQQHEPDDGRSVPLKEKHHEDGQSLPR